jgi:hypothetical protein
MSAESDLKRLFAETGPNLGSVDLDRVLRRSSRRRVVQQVAVGGATTLAVAGIGVASVVGIRGIGSQTGSGSSSVAGSAGSPAKDSRGESATEAPSIQRAPADKLNLCGGTLADVSPNASGLVLTAHFAAADASADRVDGTVTLTNSGPDRITGSSPATPAITLSRDSKVLWHSNGPMIALAAVVDLAPGASMTYNASFVPVRCATEDETAGSFPQNLPHVSPGTYQVSAAIDLTRDAADGSFAGLDLVTGPTADVTLR